MSDVDFGRHTDDYATHRPGLPPSFYDRLEALGPIAGSRDLDLATGPGTIALELAARGGAVVGIDRSAEQVATATRVARERGLEGRARFETGRAEATGLDPEAFDLVTAGQSWHWFDEDAVLAEVRRVLAPGGRLAIVNYSYLVEHSDVARDTESLVLKFNPAWSMAGWSGVFPEQIDAVRHAGFDDVEAFCYDHDEPFTHERWRGRIRTCNGVGSGGLPPGEVRRFDEALAGLLAQRHPEPMIVPHRVWCVMARKSTG